MTTQMASVHCYKCQEVLEMDSGVTLGRHEECPKCFANLRCCRMCQFFDKTAYNECREPMANRILEKEKANFCDYFKVGGAENGGQEKDSLLNAANSLFKN
jgi:hypothetical protein